MRSVVRRGKAGRLAGRLVIYVTWLGHGFDFAFSRDALNRTMDGSRDLFRFRARRRVARAHSNRLSVMSEIPPQRSA